MGRQHVWEPNTLRIFGSHLGSIFVGRSNSELDLLADCLVVVSSSKYSYFSFTPFCDGRNPYTCMRERDREREKAAHKNPIERRMIRIDRLIVFSDS